MQPSEPTATCAIRFHRAGAWQGPAADHVALAYDARFLRRKRLVGAAGVSFPVDLAQVASLSDGDAFELSDGQMIAIQAAPEDVVMIRGDLARLAWHIGNRHTPCEIAPDHLVIRADRVLEEMLAGLGAALTQMSAPFNPEGGAYGLGRTLGHSHAAPDPDDLWQAQHD